MLVWKHRIDAEDGLELLLNTSIFPKQSGVVYCLAQMVMVGG